MAKVMIVVGFLVAFAAGLVVGLEMRRPSVAAVLPPPPPVTTKPTTRPSRGPGWLESELKLTAEQKQQMDQIWSEMARRGRGESERRRQQFRDERDQAILALVNPDDKPRYDAILQNYREQLQALEREMRGNFEKAVEATKAILTPEQRARYEEFLSRHRPPDRERGDRGGDRGGEKFRGGDPERGRDDRGRDEKDREDAESKRGDGATSNPSPSL